MDALIWILGSTFFVSLVSLVAVVALGLKEKVLDKLLLLFVSLSAGALIGNAFLHLIPEALEQFGTADIFLYSIVGFSAFFLVEKLFHWHHCHKGMCHEHSFAYMNLFGDAVHNVIDGIVIGASFLASPALGISATIAIAIHELPQGIGNYGVMLYAKFNKIRALLLNFLVSLTVILGGLASYLFSEYAGKSTIFLLPFAAGGFVYIAASDLIPQLRRETNIWKSLLNFVVFIAGIAIIYVL